MDRDQGVMPMIAPPDTRSFATETTQVRFVNPAGMQIGWQVDHGYAESQLTAPARYNFQQGATYRLKVANIANREGLVLYPSLQVYPSHPSTDAYLSHNSVPVEITDEDLDQVEANNFVSKVIYLPDAKFQELAIAGVETLVSTRLDPGVDPVTEADRRGTVMVVLRLGNMDLEVPQTYGGPAAGPAAQAPGMNGISQIGYEQTITLDGSKGQFRPPMPIAIDGAQQMRMPTATLMGAPGGPGQGSYKPDDACGLRSAVGSADDRHPDRSARSGRVASGRPGDAAIAHDSQPFPVRHRKTEGLLPDGRPNTSRATACPLR